MPPPGPFVAVRPVPDPVRISFVLPVTIGASRRLDRERSQQGVVVAENQNERRWIVEPPAAGEVSLFLAFGEGVELSPEQEVALSELMRSLETDDAEVTGHAKCALSTCDHKSCNPVKCATFICNDLTSKLTGGVGSSWSIMGSFSPIQ